MRSLSDLAYAKNLAKCHIKEYPRKISLLDGYTNIGRHSTDGTKLPVLTSKPHYRLADLYPHYNHIP